MIKKIKDGTRYHFGKGSCLGQTYNYSILLKMASSIQIKNKYFECESCKKHFNRKAYLMRHIKTIHEGQRNYKCNSCGKSFTTSGNLKNHIKTSGGTNLSSSSKFDLF